jgi:ABC-type nitrate/sulfonate/bicarbonate transport system permease component
MFCFGFVETHAMRVLGIQSGTMAVSVILPAQLPAILSGWLCIY